MWLDQCEQVLEDCRVLEDKDLLFFQYFYSSYIAQGKQKWVFLDWKRPSKSADNSEQNICKLNTTI